MSQTLFVPVDLLTADELVAECRQRGVRLHRQVEPPMVGALTTDADAAAWLMSAGATRRKDTAADGSYTRDRVTGLREFDFDLHMATVREHYVKNDEGELVRDAYVGAQAIWEAAAPA